jgi:hypothetical protein
LPHKGLRAIATSRISPINQQSNQQNNQRKKKVLKKKVLKKKVTR